MVEFLAAQNWFVFIQSVGIVASLLLSVFVLRRDTKSRRISNYINLTQYHRDIWKMTVEHPSLRRVLELDSELQKEKLTAEEHQFLTFVFLHITCSFELQKNNHMIKIEMLEYDIADLLKAPLVRRFWEENKRFYNTDFSNFVERGISFNSKKLVCNDLNDQLVQEAKFSDLSK